MWILASRREEQRSQGFTDNIVPGLKDLEAASVEEGLFKTGPKGRGGVLRALQRLPISP